MKERTLFLIKPDGVSRGLVGEIIARLEKTGLKLVGLKFVQVPEELARAHYGTADDGWYRKIGEKMKKFYEQNGFDLGEQISQLSPEAIGQLVHKLNVDYLVAGPVVATVWQGVGAVATVRKLVGTTYPFDSPMGTIRGDFSHDTPVVANNENRSVYNLVHASGNPDEAKTEIELWFKEGELLA
ncbi:MAG: nucleoside-diphosphate kinase [Candidatus Vogelbacteria bacterium]|nr:nucleoside-diphosphate kinase [Candidatus Vogelbacteria bacterium]